jgi:serine-type D-Ala-D-Ala carboxypeptidase/endopeptidase (penicillin-binding protein 4)
MKHLPSRTTLVAAALVALAAPRSTGASPAPTDEGAPEARPSHTAKARSAVRSGVRPSDVQMLRRDGGPTTLDERLADDIKRIWAGRTLRRGTTAVYVVDEASGRVIYAVHEDQPLNPASNVKLVSTAAALDILGPSWRYLTRVLGPTPDAAGVVAGDLYIIGSYDPTFRTVHVNRLAAALARAGVSRVEGDVLVGGDVVRDSVGDHRVTIVVRGGARAGEPARIEVTPPNEFVEVVAPDTSNVRRSRLSLQGEVVDDEERGPRYVVTVTGRLGVDARRTYQRWVPSRNLYTGHLLRAALVEAGVEVTGTVRAVELPEYTARLGATGQLPVELARHRSVPASTIVARINKSSINYMADRLVNTAGAVLYGGKPTMDKGVRAMDRWLAARAEIDPASVLLDTGSGLSYNTQLTARQVVRVLRVAAGYAADVEGAEPGDFLDRIAGDGLAGDHDEVAGDDTLAELGARLPVMSSLLDGLAPTFDPADGGGHDAGGDHVAYAGAPALMTDTELRSALALDPAHIAATDRGQIARVFFDSLAVGGSDGTLRRRYRGSAAGGNVFAKTGTLRGIIALSGFVTLGEEETLTFAIVTNDSDSRARNQIRREHDRMVEAMHRYLEARRTQRLAEQATSAAAGAE